MSEVLLVDVKDLTLVYETAISTDAANKEESNYLLGVIEGTLGKFFEAKEKQDG